MNQQKLVFFYSLNLLIYDCRGVYSGIRKKKKGEEILTKSLKNSNKSFREEEK